MFDGVSFVIFFVINLQVFLRKYIPLNLRATAKIVSRYVYWCRFLKIEYRLGSFLIFQGGGGPYQYSLNTPTALSFSSGGPEPSRPL